MSLEKYSARKVSDRILDLVDDLVRIRRCAETLVEKSVNENDMAEEAVTALEEDMARFSHNSEALTNAIVTLTKSVFGLDGEEVDVVPTENGLRF